MNFLLDTSVVSEWAKPHPAPAVISWLAAADEDRVFISVITLAELRYGVERMPAGARKNRLDEWVLRDLPNRFEGRVHNIDPDTASLWGYITAQKQRAGFVITAMDAFIAAIARQHGLTLVTRNIADFDGCGLALFNPWAA